MWLAVNAIKAGGPVRVNATAKTILVVDDADFIRRLVSIILKVEGYNVLEADSGKEALGILSETRVDMLITDINMPVMDGFELVCAMRSEPACKHIPVIMLTSEFLEFRKQQAFNAGINEWVPKPYITSKLRDVVFKLDG